MSVPTCVEVRERTLAMIEGLDDENQRAVVQVWNDHWWAEVHNDIDAVMATMPDDPVYRIYGPLANPPMMVINSEPGSKALARAMYDQSVAAGVLLAPPFENEQFTFTSWGMIFDCISLAVFPGAMMSMMGGSPAPSDDPEQLWFVRSPVSMIVPFDFERRLMLGEVVYSGAPLSVEPTDEAMISRLLGFDRG